MGIRKVDLKEFIQNKVKVRKNALHAEARLAVEAVLKPVIFEAYKEAALLERQEQILYDSMVELLPDKHFNDWHFGNLAGDINRYVLGLREQVVKRQTGLALYNLFDQGTNHLNKEVLPFVEDIKLSQAHLIKEYQTLVKLEGEITTVIGSCHNGDKAYKRLEELGVDLTGFKGATSNLPAVIKLSADVCVLNGNC